MAATWLDFLLSRRYALTVTGDPIPTRSPAAGTVSTGPAAGGGLAAQAKEHMAETQAHLDADVDGRSAAPATLAHKTAAHDAGPFLILPNNPSLIDPLLLYAHVAAIKPLVVLRHEQSPALRMFAGSADMVILPPAHERAASPSAGTNTAARAIPDAGVADAGDPDHRADVVDAAERTSLTSVADTLAQGRSVILWPSPHVQHTGYECVPAHNAAFSLLRLLHARGQALPELFLVRAEGLWGSRFSWYRGQAPSFAATVLAQLPAILLGPFLQRRAVRLVVRRHTLRQPLERRAFQAILNAWFGAGHEGALLVPRLPLCRIRRMPLEVLTQAEACATVHAAMQAASAAIAPPALQPEGTAFPQSAAQPLPTADSPSPALAAQRPLSQPAHEPDAPQQDKQARLRSSEPAQEDPKNAPPKEALPVEATPKEALPEEVPPEEATPPKAAQKKIAAAPNAPLADLSPSVPRTPPLLPVQHALTRQGSVTDASYGQHFSRRTLLGLAKAIGTLLGPVPATRIGMSLPCGTGALASYIAILDCTLEDDRIPVILDPSMSPDQLAQCAQETGISHVVTSRSFKGRGLPPNTLPLYLEDITPAQLMRGSALSFMGFAGTTEVDSVAAIICSPATASASAHGSNDSRADIQPLFLQHQELMAALHNLMGQLSAPPLTVHSLSILGCLPPHSPLGLLVNVVLPLTCGVPIVTVNATHNASVLARSAENYSVNFFSGSPDSMGQLLREARSHLPFRYVMLSQEPCPPELLALIPKACPHASIFSADRHGNIVLL